MSSLFNMTLQERESAANMNALNKALIEEIYATSRVLGISQKDIADKIGTNKSVISRLLQGRGNPTFRTVAEICAAIGVKPELSFNRVKLDSNIGQAVVSKGAGRTATSQHPTPQVHKFLFSDKSSSTEVVENV